MSTMTAAVNATKSHSASRRAAKAGNIGAPKGVHALMIKVGHTNSPTITITAKKDLDLACATIDTRTGQKVKDAPVKVLEGTVLVLVASSIAGYYYIGRVSGAGRAGCSCPSHQNRHECKHQPLIEARAKAKAERKAVATEVVFHVGGREVSAPTAAEALLQALELISPREEIEVCGVCRNAYAESDGLCQECAEKTVSQVSDECPVIVCAVCGERSQCGPECNTETQHALAPDDVASDSLPLEEDPFAGAVIDALDGDSPALYEDDEEDETVPEHFAKADLIRYEKSLEDMPLKDLREMVASAGLATRSRAKQPLIEALVARKRVEIEAGIEELPELPAIEEEEVDNEPFSEEEIEEETEVTGKMVPSAYQQAIFDAVAAGEKAIVVTAVPGSGKTTTSKELIRYLSTESTVLALAFNSDAAKHLGVKIDEMLEGMRAGGLPTPQVDSRTIHSLGNATLVTAGLKSTVKKNKYIALCREYLEAEDIYSDNIARHLSKLVDMVRLTLSATDEISLLTLCSRFEIDDLYEDQEIWDVVLEAVPVILKRGIEVCRKERVIDYTDMIYLPHALKLQPRKYDYVLVDEAQDLSPAQRELVLKARKQNGAFIAVGDKNQAIYGFAGASLRSIDEIIEATNAKELPLSICYRCPKAVVELAASIYPGIEAAPTAKDDNAVIAVGKEQVDSLVQAGDLILCRMTAPLVSKCLELLRSGKRANVRGKDLGTTFISLLEKIEKFSKREFRFSNLEECVYKYEARQVEILSSSNADESESKIETLKDKIETLLALYGAFLDRDGEDLGGFLSYIKSFFAEDKDAQIILSTGHRAKGLEYKRVFILQSDKPLKAKTPETLIQELNLRYVMYTRAQEVLYLVVEHVAAKPEEAMVA